MLAIRWKTRIPHLLWTSLLDKGEQRLNKQRILASFLYLGAICRIKWQQ